MSLFRRVQLCAVATLFAVGCQSTGPRTASFPHSKSGAVRVETATNSVTSAARSPGPSSDIVSQIKPVTHREESSELSLPQLVADVQARNPSLQAMISAWQSAAQRYPQVVSLDDPMFSSIAAPASFDNDELESAYALQGGQKLPWFGKRAARGRQARAETASAFHEVQDSRLRLVAITQTAYFDYYLVRRQRELIDQNVVILRQFRDTADAKYRASQVTQQDLLQADVELIELERRQIELERMNRVAVARINTLLRVPPYAPLAAPPHKLEIPPGQFNPELLQQLAIAQRPDLTSIAAQVRAEQAAVAVAMKAYYPDVEFFGRYDTFWQPSSTQGDLRGQVGVNLNMPLYRGRLNAAVREAMFRVSQRRSEYEQRVLDIQYEVVTAYEQLEESRRTLRLFSERLIPVAEQNVSAARANYEANTSSFLELATAQRQLVTLREEQEAALAMFHTRLAELERATGGPVLTEVTAEEVRRPPADG
ncbi:MAG: TolC family protein [Planctomycetia bacterium]|nr:TolC family protein [Planctomycetia bacterium]